MPGSVINPYVPNGRGSSSVRGDDAARARGQAPATDVPNDVSQVDTINIGCLGEICFPSADEVVVASAPRMARPRPLPTIGEPTPQPEQPRPQPDLSLGAYSGHTPTPRAVNRGAQRGYTPMTPRTGEVIAADAGAVADRAVLSDEALKTNPGREAETLIVGDLATNSPTPAEVSAEEVIEVPRPVELAFVDEGVRYMGRTPEGPTGASLFGEEEAFSLEDVVSEAVDPGYERPLTEAQQQGLAELDDFLGTSLERGERSAEPERPVNPIVDQMLDDLAAEREREELGLN